jgi:ABC-type dipeptide/oligopeptide/nickel transport system ATPase component
MSICINDLIFEKRFINKITNSIKKYKKPVLLVGPSGIGKTYLITSIAKYLKYKITNINYDSNYKENKKSFFIKKEIILLDNLEEIKGQKLKDLVDYFVKDGRPLFMCTSDIHKDLQQIKTKLKIRATNLIEFDLTDWVNYLQKKYNIERKLIKKLVRQTRFNKAIALNQLNIQLMDLNDFQLTKNLSMWEVYENAFNKNTVRSDYYFRETMLPTFVWENYPKLKDNSLEYCNNSASACAITDIMETYYKKKQYYEFMPYVNIFTTEMSTFNYNEKLNYVRFPSYFSKMKKKSDDLILEGILESSKKKKNKSK